MRDWKMEDNFSGLENAGRTYLHGVPQFLEPLSFIGIDNSNLKTYLFHKLFPAQTVGTYRTAFRDFRSCTIRFYR